MRPFSILGAAAVMACASAGGGGTTVDANNPNIITGDQIGASAQTNAVTTYGMQYGAGVIDIRTK